MKTYIYPIHGEYVDEVLSIIVAHPEWYGETDKANLLHPHFYILVDTDGKLIAFFGIAAWVEEDVLCYVYVKDEYRRQGLFNKMVKYVKDHCYTKSITIGACKGNDLANKIYGDKFLPLGLGDDGANHYIIVDRRKVK